MQNPISMLARRLIGGNPAVGRLADLDKAPTSTRRFAVMPCEDPCLGWVIEISEHAHTVIISVNGVDKTDWLSPSS
jgi:hypothetical protein